MTEEAFEKTQIPENDLFAEWLGETRFITGLIVDITDCLAILAGKRVTLEEKMIRQELHSLVANYGEAIAIVHNRLAAGNEPAWELLEKLRTMDFRVREEINKFLKALRYNLNYVEQYFEFDFCARLREECRFASECAEIVAALRAS